MDLSASPAASTSSKVAIKGLTWRTNAEPQCWLSSHKWALAALLPFLIGGCATGTAVKGAGSELSQGNVLGALYLGTIGVAVSAIYDVATLGGALDSNSGGGSSQEAAQLASTSTAAESEQSELEIAREELAKTESNLRNAQTAESFISSMGKDASTARMQRQMYEAFAKQQREKVQRLASKEEPLAQNMSDSSERSSSQSGGVTSSSSGCKTTLAHLSARLPLYNVAEIQQVRIAILGEDLQRAAQKAKSMGLSTAQAASQSLQAADNADGEVIRAAGCIRNFANTPEPVMNSLEAGTFKFSGKQISELNIHQSCAAQYVVLKYTAIALRESAVQMACLARSSR